MTGRPLAGIDAIVLAGGRGTRLASLGPGQKAARPVAGRPLLERLLERLAEAGVRRAVVAAGHRHEDVERVCAEFAGGLETQVSVEPRPLGTGGALALAREAVASDPVLVLNGDTWAPVDLGALLARHRERAALVTLAVVERSGTEAFGRVVLGASDEVVGFEEKPPGGGAGLVNAGVYLFSRAALARLGPPRPLSLERDVLAQAAGSGLWAARFSVPLLDIGTPASLARAESFFARARP